MATPHPHRVVHSHSCSLNIPLRTARHDRVTKKIHDHVVPMVCNNAKLEPPGRNLEDKKRPDIEFRNLNDDGTESTASVDCGGYHTIDINIPSIHLVLMGRTLPPCDTAYWKTAWDKKQNKHGTKCLPFIISTYGGLEPRVAA